MKKIKLAWPGLNHLLTLRYGPTGDSAPLRCGSRRLHSRVATLDDPRSIGEALKGSKLGEFWKYRIGDYRVIARIEDAALRVLVVRVGSRDKVYR